MFEVTPHTECELLITHYYYRLFYLFTIIIILLPFLSRNVRGMGNDLSCALSQIQIYTDHPWLKTDRIRQKHIIPHSTLLAFSLQEGSMCRAPYRDRHTFIQILKTYYP